MRQRPSGLAQWLLFAVLAVGLGGCASLGGSRQDSPAATLLEPPAAAQVPGAAGPQPQAGEFRAGPTGPDLSVVTLNLDAEERRPQLGEAAPGDSNYLLYAGSQFALAAESDAPLSLAQQRAGGPPPDTQIEEYDPWEPFNETMFEFNRGLDRWILKPVAKVYRKIVPDLFQDMIASGFDNISVPPRFVNCLLQGKVGGAGRELGRLVLNSTLGIGGLFDIARQEFKIEKCNEDTGQTFGFYGIGPGPYLVLPFLPPLTVRDAIGYLADGAMDPISYFVPFIWTRLAMKAGDTINDRARNIDLYQGFEEATVELYSALRNAYLQRRLKLISE